MHITAFHAVVRGVGLADYWHNQGDCFIAKSIAAADRLPGQGKRPYCPYCALLLPRGSSRPTAADHLLSRRAQPAT